MSERRLEWTRCSLDQGPLSWTLLAPPAACRWTEDAPGWSLPSFRCADPESGISLECAFTAWCPYTAGVAIYAAEEWHYEAWTSYPGGEVYVREVPAALVVTCSLVHIENRDFEAVLTTLAGSMVLHIPKASSLSPSMEELAVTPALAAAAQGRLKSRNQEVRTVLAGRAESLGSLVVPDFFWDTLVQHDAEA